MFVCDIDSLSKETVCCKCCHLYRKRVYIMPFLSGESASPATPHSQTNGINKSFLTPCRRIGLKRKSPNISHRSPADSDRNRVLSDNIIHEELLPRAKCCSPSNLNEGTSEKLMKSAETPKRGECLLSSSFVTKERGLRRKQRRTETDVADTESTPHRGIEFIASKSTEDSQHTELETPVCYDQATLETLRKMVAEKEDKVQSLKIAHLYKKKHDISRLKETISKWKDGCQCALQDLLVITQQRGHEEITMVQLLGHLGIPPDLVGYDPEQEEFL